MHSLRDFDGTDVPLVMGTVRGVRSFLIVRHRATGTLHLSGCVYTEPWWKPGENEAVHQGWGRNPHEVAKLHCSCGFYAYFERRNTYQARYRTVTGIIEAYGRVTMGDKGFRASKARIVALVDPTPRWARWAQGQFNLPPLEIDSYFPQIAAHYEVPVYPTLSAARREHPTGKPL